jgi:hypothetical protein
MKKQLAILLGLGLAALVYACGSSTHERPPATGAPSTELAPEPSPDSGDGSGDAITPQRTAPSPTGAPSPIPGPAPGPP